MKIAIAGSSGFIGTRLIESLKGDSKIDRIFALSRSGKAPIDPRDKIEFRKTDLADLAQTEAGIRGADLAIYLVHSMSPQARLSQGSFDDFDLHQADNFARACHAEGIQNIFYLGGLIPDSSSNEENWSAHLRSRLEVERVLTSYGAKTTAFRAGLIIGKGGSSSEMLFKLVKRLPVMLAPTWTQTPSEPVDVDDVIYAIHQTVFKPELQGQAWDLSAGERLSYRMLMIRAAQILGLKRIIIPVPILSPSVSKLWVSLVSGAPRTLVYPLIKSLTHEMLSRPDHLILKRLGRIPKGVDLSLKSVTEAMSEKSLFRPGRRDVFRVPTVRSIQRFTGITLTHLKKIGSITERYIEWLPQFLLGILSVRKILTQKETRIQFTLRFTPIILLDLTRLPHAHGSIETYQITGGFLRAPDTGGTLEFRYIPSERSILAIVQDFVPRLPWPIYRVTQALIHLWVMRRFGSWLQTQDFTLDRNFESRY